jgi:tetratricopeptide (TPR) repeat protein
LGREREAEEHFEAALELRPGLYGAHQSLARLSWKRGDRAVAIAHYEAMIAIAPENPTGHFLMGRALQARGRPRRALDHYRSALGVDPDHEGARKAVERIEDRRAGSPTGSPVVELPAHQ